MAAPNFPIERRLRAAMALAGMDFPALAKALGRQGMGARMLRYWADPEDTRTPQPHHLRYIAEACNISPAFFTVDFGAIEHDAATSTDELGERVRRLEAEVAVLSAEGLQRSAGREPATRDRTP